MSRYTARQIQAVLDGRMDDFFAEGPHPGSTARAKATDVAAPVAVASVAAPAAPVASVAAASPPAAKPAPKFMDLVVAEMSAGKSKSAAVRAVAIARPDLHRKYLDEFNVQAGKVTALERQRAGLGRDLRESRAARASRRLSVR